MEFQYFSVDFAIEVHDGIIRESGGFRGIRDKGLIESTLEHVKNDFYYPELEDKLTHILFSFNKNHCFNDGNKRASIALLTYFLSINNLSSFITKFTLEMENVVVDVADNVVDRDLLHELICCLVYEDEFNEELKLKLIHAKLNHLAKKQ
jgi:death-on-curing protein